MGLLIIFTIAALVIASVTGDLWIGISISGLCFCILWLLLRALYSHEAEKEREKKAGADHKKMRAREAEILFYNAFAKQVMERITLRYTANFSTMAQWYIHNEYKDGETDRLLTEAILQDGESTIAVTNDGIYFAWHDEGLCFKWYHVAPEISFYSLGVQSFTNAQKRDFVDFLICQGYYKKVSEKEIGHVPKNGITLRADPAYWMPLLKQEVEKAQQRM